MTPTQLKAWRITLGLDPETLAAWAGVKPDQLRNSEAGWNFNPEPWHREALESVHVWMIDEAPKIGDQLLADARAGAPAVVWFYRPSNFKTACRFAPACRNVMGLYHIAAADALETAQDAGHTIEPAEFNERKFRDYAAHQGEPDMPDTPANRLRWWRAYRRLYGQSREDSK